MAETSTSPSPSQEKSQPLQPTSSYQSQAPTSEPPRERRKTYKQPVQAEPSYQPQSGPSSSDKEPEKPKSRFQRFKEKVVSVGTSIKSSYETARQSPASKKLQAHYQTARKSAAVGFQKHVVQPARGFGREILVEAKTGYAESKAETKSAIKSGAKAITRSPVALGSKVRERIKIGRQAMRERRGIEWGGGIVPKQESFGRTRGVQPRAMQANLFETALDHELPRQRGTGRFKGSTGGIPKIQLQFGHERRPYSGGRQPRISVPKGLVKTYWSKKLKKLARTNIRRFGAEEGLVRTKQIADLAGWKWQ